MSPTLNKQKKKQNKNIELLKSGFHYFDEFIRIFLEHKKTPFFFIRSAVCQTAKK